MGLETNGDGDKFHSIDDEVSSNLFSTHFYLEIEVSSFSRIWISCKLYRKSEGIFLLMSYTIKKINGCHLSSVIMRLIIDIGCENNLMGNEKAIIDEVF